MKAFGWQIGILGMVQDFVELPELQGRTAGRIELGADSIPPSVLPAMVEARGQLTNESVRSSRDADLDGLCG